VADALLDTSVLIAFIFGEAHDVNEDTVLAGGAIASVNLAETISVMRQKGGTEAEIRDTLRELNLDVVPFNEAMAERAGTLIPQARTLNIGLGDCACIATGLVLRLPIWTADRDWLKLDAPGADIKLIRNPS